MKLHQLLDEKRKARTVVLAVAPDSLSDLKKMSDKVSAKTGIPFGLILLADTDHRVIDQYGLLNEAAAARGRFLPHPTTYVIDARGVVRWKFTETDYKIRPSNEQIIEQLIQLR